MTAQAAAAGPGTMNDLERFFEEGRHTRLHKWRHYFEIYDRHFSRFRGGDVTMVEVGVKGGGSVQMWKNYFGPRARIIGIDVLKRCRRYAEDQIEIVIGDQGDPGFWSDFRTAHPKVDILLDDGGHHMNQMRVTFEEMYGHLSSSGVYVCEDLHACYLDRYGGGLGREGTFVELLKGKVDELNAWVKRGIEPNDFTRTTQSIHFYGYMAVLERRPMQAPRSEVKNTVDPDDPESNQELLRERFRARKTERKKHAG